MRIASARIRGFGSSESYAACVSDENVRAEVCLVDSGHASHTLADRNDTHLDKRVHGKDDELRLCLCIVHKVEVDEFLLFQVVGLHVLEDIWEKPGDVLSDGHVGNDAFDCVLPFVPVFAIQVRAQLVVLP